MDEFLTSQLIVKNLRKQINFYGKQLDNAKSKEEFAFFAQTINSIKSLEEIFSDFGDELFDVTESEVD